VILHSVLPRELPPAHDHLAALGQAEDEEEGEGK